MKTRRFLAVTVGVMVLSGGLVLANYGGGVTPAGAKDLSGVTPNWDQNFPSGSRFTTVFTGAVRDNNTGLVWEQKPDTTTRPWGDNIGSATLYCVNKPVGGTRGWRLPSVAELASLIDPSLPAPFVPASVFTDVQQAKYWSATMGGGNSDIVWDVNFNTGAAETPLDKTDLAYAWCVRGPSQESMY